MSRIDSYHFGQIVVDGKKYSSDVIIFPERVQAAWRRKKSHELLPDEVSQIIAESPEVLIIGTGAMGQMRIASEATQLVEAQGIRLIAVPTGEACDIYNQISSSEKTIAALHLTC